MLVLLTLLAIVNNQSASDVPPGERRVLMELYASTRGDAWTDRSGWGSTESVCQWRGVWCDFLDGDATQPVVAGLSLDLNNLDGELPSTLAELKHLQRLSVIGNKLRGKLPEVLLQRWDRHVFELDANYNAFSNALARVKVDFSASGVLCSEGEDLRYRLEVDEANRRATFQSVRCVDPKSRNTYCLVREGSAPSLMRLSRGLGSLGFARLKPDYDFPFTGMTHGVFLTTEAVWGDGTKTSVRTYARQGPIDAWNAQQLFLGLLADVGWDRDIKKPKCDFEQ
jgi:hypothetical protein